MCNSFIINKVYMHRGIPEARDQPQWDLRAVNGQVKG